MRTEHTELSPPFAVVEGESNVTRGRVKLALGEFIVFFVVVL